MKKSFIEFVLLIILLLLMHFEFISFAESIIIYLVTIGLEYTLKELKKIRVLLQELNYPPFHTNCRHQIIEYFSKKEVE